MKILLISEFFPTGKDLKFTGGVESRTYFLAKNLSVKHQVTVISSRQPATKAIENISNFKVLRVGPQIEYTAGSGKNPFALLGFIKSAIEEGNKIDSHIVDGGNFIAHLIAKQIANSKKIPVVYWYPDVFIGQWFKTSGIIPGISGYLLERLNLTRGADTYIAISNTTRKKLIDFGIESKKVEVIYCGADIQEFKNNQSKKIEKILTISRLVHYKRIKDLILAFAKISHENKELTLEIIGRGPEENNLKDLVKNLNLVNRVTFISNLARKDLISKIQSAKIFCLPSQVEGFGIATIEAAAAGVPYVVSSIEVFKEVTKNGKGGLLFETGNIPDLANKLQKLLDDKKLYIQKQNEALELAKNYDWKSISSQTESLYKSLIKK